MSLVAVALSAIALVVSCGKDNPLRPPGVAMGTPEDAVHAAVRAWSNRDTTEYCGMLAPGSLFYSVCTEGPNLILTDVHDDQGERYVASRLFRLGTESLPAAISIGISIDGPLSSFDYKDPTTALVDVPMTLGVVTTMGTTFHRGNQFISLIRGDAAEGGTPADSTYWLIDSWAEILVSDMPHASREAIRRLMDSARARTTTNERVTAGSYCDSALATTWNRVRTRYLEGYDGPPVVPFKSR